MLNCYTSGRSNLFPSSLRGRLLIILLVAIVPALGLTLYTGLELRRNAISYGQDTALRYARSTQDTEQRVVQRTEQLLESLAGTSEAHSSDAAVCRQFLNAELKQHLSFVNLGVAAPNGDVFCSAAPLRGPLNVADWAFFRRALHSQSFAIGDYRLKGIGGKPTLNFGYPLLDAARTVGGVVFAEVDIDEPNRALTTSLMPQGSLFFIVDRNGTILSVIPVDGKWVGRTVPASIIPSMRASYQEQVVVEARSPDGVSRLYASVPLDDLKQGGLTFAVVAIPSKIAYDIAHTTARNLLVLSLLAAVVFTAAWVGGNLLVLQPVTALLATTRRLSAGDLSARTGLGEGSGELAQLARTFDETAAKLQRREAEAARIGEELRRYGAQLEQRVAERTADLEAARKEADRANQVKSEFLSKMSHELRTPLNAVIGFSEMLLERMVGDLTTKQEEFVRDIRESGKHLLSLVNDILDLSRIEAGRMELHITQTDLREVVKGAEVTLQPLIERKRLVLSISVDPHAAIIDADPVRLKQILYNLLSNAVKFTPEGGQIRVGVARIDEKVKMVVADTGPGISPEDQQKLFRPFTQLPNAQQTEYAGTGLGLVLVQRLAELHGGQVELESEVGKGSRFIVWIPVVPRSEFATSGSIQDPG